MRPNARTINKVLMKRRVWPSSPRALVTVRLPVTVAPEPPPPRDYCAAWGKRLDAWTWEHTEPDGAVTVRTLREFGERFEGFQYPRQAGQPRYASLDLQDAGQLPRELVEPHERFERWLQYFTWNEGPKTPLIAAFFRAAWNAKTHAAELSADGQFIYLTYWVKWQYPQSRRDFCADLMRAFRFADALGVDARLMR